MGNAGLVEGRQDCTAGFMGMCAVAKTAVMANLEDFRKEVSHFVAVEVHGTEAAYSRGVDYRAASGQVKQFGECGGVHAGVVYGRYFGGA